MTRIRSHLHVSQLKLALSETNRALDYETEAEDQLAEYDRYMARELPRLVRNQLEAIVLRASEPLETGLQSQLIDIIRTSQREIFRTYAAKRDPQGSAADERETTYLGSPPTGMLAGFFPPPSLVENNFMFPDQNFLQVPGGLYPPVGLSSFSDSAYSSQNANSLDAVGQAISVGVQLPAGTTDALPQLSGSDAANDTQQDDFTSSAEPWSNFSNYDGTY